MKCTNHHFACECREDRIRELLEDVMRCHSTPDDGNYNECDKDPCAWCIEALAVIAHGHPEGVLGNDMKEAVEKTRMEMADETPETDEFWENSAGGSNGHLYARDFCRQMERERNSERRWAHHYKNERGEPNE